MGWGLSGDGDTSGGDGVGWGRSDGDGVEMGR
jgi:hypothetical protein